MVGNNRSMWHIANDVVPSKCFKSKVKQLPELMIEHRERGYLSLPMNILSEKSQRLIMAKRKMFPL